MLEQGRGKLLGRGEINGNEYTREVYGVRIGGEQPFDCDSCGDKCEFGHEVVLVEDGSGYHSDCFDDLDDGSRWPEYHCGVSADDWGM